MKRRSIILAFLTIFFIHFQVFGEEVDLQKLVQETQKNDRKDNTFRFIWWIPTEYWKESFKKSPNMTSIQKEEIYKTLDNYFVVCIIDAKINLFGGIVSLTREELIKELSLTLDSGEKFKPLSDMDVSSDAKTFFNLMKPVVANMLGQFGQGFEFFCFTGKNKEGKYIVDPKADKSFIINLGDSSFKWRLPLGSLLPSKYDPDTDEKFPGNYNYNPFTGKKLKDK